MQEIRCGRESQDHDKTDRPLIASSPTSVYQSGNLVPWNDILIDGHNRYAICTKNNIPFNIIHRDFASREEALIWIVSTQISRRNLNPIQLSHYRGLHYQADRKMITNKEGINQKRSSEGVVYQNDKQPHTLYTAARLAKQYHVSTATISRDAKLAQGIEAIGKISPDARRKIINSQVNINKKELNTLSTKPTSELKKIAAAIDKGTYTNPKPTKPAAPASTTTPAAAAAAGTSTPTAPTQHLDPQQLNTTLNMIETNFHHQWQNSLKQNNPAQLKQHLRSYLDKLEGLYQQI